MKKLLGVLCIAIMAGGFMFSSCTKTFTIKVEANNADWGTVVGDGNYAENAVATLMATPNAGYKFVKWNDGNTENPREITVTENATYTAFFEAIPVEPGVKVTFKGNTWKASKVGGARFQGTTQGGTPYDYWTVAGVLTENQFPLAEVAMNAQTKGTYNSGINQNGQLSDNNFRWIEYYESRVLNDEDNNKYGDWWAKNATVNITSFDATALVLTSKVNATMFSAFEGLAGENPVGIDAATTTQMDAELNNIHLELNPSKASAKKAYKGQKLLVK